MFLRTGSFITCFPNTVRFYFCPRASLIQSTSWAGQLHITSIRPSLHLNRPIHPVDFMFSAIFRLEICGLKMYRLGNIQALKYRPKDVGLRDI